MLVDGKWPEDWQPVQAKEAKGGFVRQTSSFRSWVTPDGAAGPTGEGGFATTQLAYEEAFHGVFEMLDALEERLEDRTYLFGDALTEADIRLFVTLVRFDAAFYGLFKANLRRIADYPNLSAYLSRLLAIPAFRDSTNISHIKRGYYSIKSLNPSGIVPLGPEGPMLDGNGI